MAKSDTTKVVIDKEAIYKLKREVDEIIINDIKANKEKIAFSLFCMHCYSHDFVHLLEDYLIDMKINELLEMWELGKLKNKLQYFFNLAEKFYNVNFDK